jgi:phosphohistidine phosphatase
VLLYLVRHAIADDPDPIRWPDDSQRPLTNAGRKKFQRAARGLGDIARRADVVVSSPYLRAWQTAEILSEEAGWASPTRLGPLSAGTSADAAYQALREYAGAEVVAAVGHEPTMHELASLLLTGDPYHANLEFKKGTVACLRTDGPFHPSRAQLLWLATPKLLRRLGEE